MRRDPNAINESGEASMNIQVSWYDESRTILCFACVADWDWEDFHRAIEEGYHMMGEVDHQVHMVIDMGRFGQLPKGNAMVHFRQVMGTAQSQSNRGYVVMTNPNAFGRALANTFMRVYRKEEAGRWTRFVSTFEEALTFLSELVPE